MEAPEVREGTFTEPLNGKKSTQFFQHNQFCLIPVGCNVLSMSWKSWWLSVCGGAF